MADTKVLLDPTSAPHGSGRLMPAEVLEYLEALHGRYDEAVLLEMEGLARERGFPIVGRLAGIFLQLVASTSRAKRIFEFGSGFGYSAYWFARGVGTEGKVICTDGSVENFELAESFLSRADLWDRVKYHSGLAQNIFERVDGDFDIIYNDADKCDYPEIWQSAVSRLCPGGLYIADNALWGGRVAMERVLDDPVPGFTEAVRLHNELIAKDPRFDFFLNPIRDGLIVARKK